MTCRPALLLLAGSLPLAGCTGFMNHLTVDSTSKVLAVAVPTANYESDPEIMRQSLPGTIKTIEGFLAGQPDNLRLRRILAQVWGEYSFGFVASDYEQAKLDHKPDDVVQPLHDRATDYYIRSFAYGLSMAQQFDDGWENAVYSQTNTTDAVKAELAKMDGTDEDQVASVFWMAFGLGQAIDINRDQDYLLGYLPVVRELFAWVADKEPDFYNGAAFAGLGSLDGAQPKALGGDPERAKSELERAIELTHGQFLMNKVMLAHVYAYAVQDKKLYVDTLTAVLGANLDEAPQWRLPNTLAKLRAKRYLAEANDLF